MVSEICTIVPPPLYVVCLSHLLTTISVTSSVISSLFPSFGNNTTTTEVVTSVRGPISSVTVPTTRGQESAAAAVTCRPYSPIRFPTPPATSHSSVGVQGSTLPSLNQSIIAPAIGTISTFSSLFDQNILASWTYLTRYQCIINLNAFQMISVQERIWVQLPQYLHQNLGLRCPVSSNNLISVTTFSVDIYQIFDTLRAQFINIYNIVTPNFRTNARVWCQSRIIFTDFTLQILRTLWWILVISNYIPNLDSNPIFLEYFVYFQNELRNRSHFFANEALPHILDRRWTSTTALMMELAVDRHNWQINGALPCWGVSWFGRYSLFSMKYPLSNLSHLLPFYIYIYIYARTYFQL